MFSDPRVKVSMSEMRPLVMSQVNLKRFENYFAISKENHSTVLGKKAILIDHMTSYDFKI